ncbi:MAG TPA: DUF3592 domain-containing protein [Thermoanaerobaculia bacterium]|nr:DUF3592 domain-containing protein [Thermoanaerobaculia bacterium]
MLLILFIEFVGGFFAWIGLKSLVTTCVRRRTWLPVEGLVTGFKKYRTSEAGRTVYRPYYRYFVEGKKYIGVSDTGSAFRRYRVKGPIRLLVNPKCPGESMVLDFGTWLFSWGIFLVGLFPMAIGVWLAVEAYAGKGK